MAEMPDLLISAPEKPKEHPCWLEEIAHRGGVCMYAYFWADRGKPVPARPFSYEECPAGDTWRFETSIAAAFWGLLRARELSSEGVRVAFTYSGENDPRLLLPLLSRRAYSSAPLIW